MKKKQLNSYLWTEAFRPTSIKEMILPASTKRFFNKLVKKGEISNLLLHSSSPGTGKCLYKDSELEIEIDEDVYNANKELFND